MSLIRIDTDTMRGIAERLQNDMESMQNSTMYIEDMWHVIKATNTKVKGIDRLRICMTHNDSLYSIPNCSDCRTTLIQAVADAILAIVQIGLNVDYKVCSALCNIVNNEELANSLMPNSSYANQYSDSKSPTTDYYNSSITPSYSPSALLEVYQQMFGDDAYNVITQALTNSDSLTPELVNTLEYLQSQLSDQTATVNGLQASANNNGEHNGYLDNYNNYVNNNGGTFNDPAYSIGGGYFEMLEQLEQESNQMQNQGTGYPTYQDNYYTATVDENDASAGMNGGETYGTLETPNNNGTVNFLNNYLTNALNGTLNSNDPGVSYMSANSGLGGAIAIIDSLVESYNNGTLNPNDPAIAYLQNTYGVDTSALFGNSSNTVNVQESNAMAGYIDNGVELTFNNNNDNDFHDPYYDYFGTQNETNQNNGFHDPYYDYFGTNGQDNNNGFHDPYYDYFGDNNTQEQTVNFQDPYNNNNQGQSNGFHDPYYDYYNVPEPSPFFNEFQQAWDTNVQNGTAMFNDPGAAYFNWKYGADFHI